MISYDFISSLCRYSLEFARFKVDMAMGNKDDKETDWLNGGMREFINKTNMDHKTLNIRCGYSVSASLFTGWGSMYPSKFQTVQS